MPAAYLPNGPDPDFLIHTHNFRDIIATETDLPLRIGYSIRRNARNPASHYHRRIALFVMLLL